MNPLLYIPSIVLLIPAYLAVYFGGWWTLVLPGVVFGLVPILELIFSGSTKNLSENLETSTKDKAVFDWLIFSTVPLQVGIVIALTVAASTGHLSGWSLLGAIASVGICCGTFGINVAHELGHRRTKFHQVLAKVLLCTSLYAHFFIEHNRGHHAKVATADDPASASSGQTVYNFWMRSIPQGWLSAWHLEDKRLRALKHPRLTLQNEMTRLMLIQFSLVSGVGLTMGLTAMVAWLSAALGGALLLETVNYVEHYGLSRKLRANGRYERVQPKHSWNSNHPIGRVLLFELTRHSDHHAYPGRKYPTLRHFDESPQLPSGYPGMILLALFPPLWFAVMDPHVIREQLRLLHAAR